MPAIYLTPASISFLTQFILAFAISLFLLYRLRRHRTRQLSLLTSFFTLATLFIGLLFLETAFAPFYRLLAVYAENFVLALMMVFLILFAYQFPRQYPQHQWEARAAFVMSLAYLCWEAGYMVYRYFELLFRDNVYYRPNFAAYSMGLVLLLAPFAFLRQSLVADTRTRHWTRKLLRAEGKEAHGARNFVGVFGILFLLGLANVLLIYRLPTTIYNAAMSIGILLALWLFASNYINFIAGGVSVQVRISVLSLTFFLALLGLVGWFVAPPYIATFQPNLTDHQTLRFTPNQAGGYDLQEIAFHFEPDLGEKVPVQIKNELRNGKVNFTFPLYGQLYHELYVANSGVISFEQPYWQPNMQNHGAANPMLLPLLIDLDPDGGPTSGLYVRRETDPDRLIVTWNQMPALYHPDKIFTFQAVLYADGVFDFTYNGLPLPFIFSHDATPSANPWMRGVVPGNGVCLHLEERPLPQACDPNGFVLLENYQLAFRHYLDHFILPLARTVVGGSLALIIALPLMLHSSIIRPLTTLTDGARKMEAGDLTVEVPIQNEDELGYLTKAFNTMAVRLQKLVIGLEDQVATRTEELTRTNINLVAEMSALASAQTQILEQQRALAALEERAHLSRELHDGLGQVLSYINVQATALQDMLANGRAPAAEANLQQLAQAARAANAALRAHLLGLRQVQQPDALQPPASLLDTLATYFPEFETRYGLKIDFWPPKNIKGPVFAPNVREQALRIIQEALTNVAKHAQATRVEIAFQVSEEEAQITIVDDGLGFASEETRKKSEREEKPLGSPSQIPFSTRFGLQIMRERAEGVGGQLELSSEPGKGTRIRLSLPRFLPYEAEEGFADLRGLRVVLADDHALFLDGLQSLLVGRGLTVVGTARDGQEAIDQVRALHPDVALLDLNMPKCDGIEATRIITSEMPQIKVVILTIPEAKDRLIEAIRSGASGYLFKDLEPNRLCRLLVGLLRGEAALSPGLAKDMMGTLAHNKAQPSTRENNRIETLTPRQWEILERTAQGQTYKEIGTALSISEATVKYHIGQIIERLNVENRNQAVSYLHQMHAEGRVPPFWTQAET